MQGTTSTSSPDHPAAREHAGLWGTLTWAGYLGSSWTWCIGMFLPILLLRDYGLLGVLAFAIPNVLGAAAMGWVLRDGASQRLTRDHPLMTRAFSVATICFHAFFVAALAASALGLSIARAGGVSIAVFAAALGLACLPLKVLRVLGLLLIPAVWLLAGFAAQPGTLGVTDADVASLTDPARVPSVLMLLPLCVLGFLTCPYLDLTFHRARASQSARGARASFAVGFGLLFASMLVLTVLYARSLTAWVVLAHVAAQSAYTMAVHLKELGDGGLPTGDRWHVAVFASMVVGAVLSIPTDLWAQAFSNGELVYRGFLYLYAIAFPAYVLGFMTRAGPGGLGADRRGWVRWGIVTALAAPLAGGAFMFGVGAAGVLAVAVVLLASPRQETRISPKPGSVKR